MNQLVAPNLNAVGTVSMCLEYASRGVFSNPAGGSTAWNAWNATQYRHPDQNFPTGVYFPIWFSYYTTINGIYGNYGHVAVMTPSGQIYSSPWQPGTTHAVLPSIGELMRIYSNGGQFPMAYVGWSEDILNLRVIKENQMQPLTPDQVNHAFLMVNQPSTNKDWAYYAQKPGELIDNLWNAYGEAQYELAKNPPPLPSGTLPAGTYIQVNPKDIHTI